MVVKEIQDQITVLLAHLHGFGKDRELMQKAMEILNVGMINMRYSVENMEVKVKDNSGSVE